MCIPNLWFRLSTVVIGFCSHSNYLGFFVLYSGYISNHQSNNACYFRAPPIPWMITLPLALPQTHRPCHFALGSSKQQQMLLFTELGFMLGFSSRLKGPYFLAISHITIQIAPQGKQTYKWLGFSSATLDR